MKLKTGKRECKYLKICYLKYETVTVKKTWNSRWKCRRHSVLCTLFVHSIPPIVALQNKMHGESFEIQHGYEGPRKLL